MDRLTSAVWVSAYLRRVDLVGAYGALVRRGDASAGAIWIEIDHATGIDLWAPMVGESARRFEKVMQGVFAQDVAERMEREERLDSDLWRVSVQDPAGRSFLLEDEVGAAVLGDEDSR